MDKNKYIFPIFIIGVVVAIILIIVFTGGSESEPEQTTNTDSAGEESSTTEEEEGEEDAETTSDSDAATPSSQLVINTLTEGEGDVVAENGNRITVDYEGRLDDENGSVFDSSYERGIPFDFVLGGGRVIAGWEQGLVGAKVGQVLTLTIPPELAYGESAREGIPPNSTLFFEIEVLDIASE